jgi:uncharacterized protein (TIGR02246 family)
MALTRKLAILLVPGMLIACEADDMRNGEPEPDAPIAAERAQVDRDAAQAELAEVRNAWARAAEAGDADAVAALYAQDASFVAPTGEVAEGRQAIREALVVEGTTSMEITSTDVEVGAELIADMGSYRQTIRTPDGEEQTLTGTYLAVLRRQPDGRWRIAQHLAAAPIGAPDAGDM